MTPLGTKLSIPPLRSDWIKRSRLLQRMNEGFARKLTLISAPAGFGKTSLVSNWVHTHKIPAGWVSLGRGDSDSAQFLTYVILGFQSLRKATGKAALAMLHTPQPPPLESVLINLINDVMQISVDTALVLDDYHYIDAEPVHDVIAFLLENLPLQVHLVLITRSDPPLPPLARLRSQNQLTELRAADLSFTAEETSLLFKQCLNLQLSTREIQLLETRTEGWIAGLQLAALSLRDHADPSGFLEQFKGDNRYIADYLTEEVLRRQPEHVREFLLQTAILDRMCGPLCDAVTRQKNSQQILNDLDTANLFVIPLDERRYWFRYHHLFGDLLKQRLYMKQADLVDELHNRASEWLADNDAMNEAVEHALVANNYARSAQLIEQIAELDWDRARDSRMLQWIKKLPEVQLQTNPKLSIFYARELFKSGHPAEAEKRLQTAEQSLESEFTDNKKKSELQGRIAVIRAYVAARTGDTPRIIQFSKLALKLLPQRDLMWRSVAATTMGFGYGWAGGGDCKKAQHAFSEAMQISRNAGNVYYEVFSGSCLGSILMMRAKMNEAKDICEQSLHLAKKNGIEQTGICGSLYGTLGMILCEWNNLEEGTRLIKKGIELSEQGRDPVIMASCCISLLRAYIYRMDFAGVNKLMEKLNMSARDFSLPPWITNTISAFNVYIWLAGSDLNSALQWVKARNLCADDKLDNLRELEYLALAHILFVQQKLDVADGLLLRLIENAKTGDRVFIMIEMRLWRAMIHKARGDMTTALDELKIALALAEPGGILMSFFSKGKPMAELLEETLRFKKSEHDDAEIGFSRSYVKKLLSVFKAAKPPKTEGLMDPISERELEVLRLIAVGLSNREIAEKLFISLNTVKSHTKSINSKLDVNSRTKAVARAKELSIL